MCTVTYVQVGTALFVEPDAPMKMIGGLQDYLRAKRVKKIVDLVGKVQKY